MATGIRQTPSIKRDDYKDLLSSVSARMSYDDMFVLKNVLLSFVYEDEECKSVIEDNRVTASSCIEATFQNPSALSKYNLHGKGQDGSIVFYADEVPTEEVRCNILVINPRKE